MDPPSISLCHPVHFKPISGPSPSLLGTTSFILAASNTHSTYTNADSREIGILAVILSSLNALCLWAFCVPLGVVKIKEASHRIATHLTQVVLPLSRQSRPKIILNPSWNPLQSLVFRKLGSRAQSLGNHWVSAVVESVPG